MLNGLGIKESKESIVGYLPSGTSSATVKSFMQSDYTIRFTGSRPSNTAMRSLVESIAIL